MNERSFTAFVMSDIHIGNGNGLMTPIKLMDNDARAASAVTREQRAATMQAVEHLVRSNDITIINGDFHDKHSIHDEYALTVLERWITKYPDKEIYFICGNHDVYDNSRFRDGLIKLANAHDTFHYDDYGLIIGNVLFTHGDLQQNNLDIESRKHPTPHRLSTGKERVEKAINQKMYLREFLNSSPHASDFWVSVRGGDKQLLTPELLDKLHVVFGHSHAPVFLDDGGKLLSNVGSMHHRPDWRGEWNDLSSLSNLQQPILHFENNMLTGHSRAFPNQTRWKDMVRTMRQEHQPYEFQSIA